MTKQWCFFQTIFGSSTSSSLLPITKPLGTEAKTQKYDFRQMNVLPFKSFSLKQVNEKCNRPGIAPLGKWRFWNVKFANRNIKLCQENTLFPTAVPQVLLINHLSAPWLSDAAAYQHSVVGIKNVPRLTESPQRTKQIALASTVNDGNCLEAQTMSLTSNSGDISKLPEPISG